MNDQITIHGDEEEQIKVEWRDGKAITTSLNVSYVFSKRHRDIMRTIDNILPKISNDFSERNFTLTDFIDKNGDKQRKYEMTQDGWAILVMGFTGEKALKFKEKYIAKFNEMERELSDNKLPALPDFNDPVAAARAWADAKEAEIKANAALEAAQPKISFHDHIEVSINSISVAEFANLLTKKNLKIGQNKLFQWFYDNKYLLNSSRPYQHALDNGWVEIRKITYQDAKNNERTTHKVMVTGKGQTYFTKKIKETLSV
jgi:anti-repressor protein